ncbi:MAG: DNA-packaging protein [Rubellimicrobium sp.]|nr:DNA-packaging protein [Rubellimicrobium sp.]
MPRGTRSGAALIASAPPQVQAEFLAALSPAALAALPWLFDFWALPHQVPPGGDWRSWLILGGRGAGKTRAGAEWVRAMVEGARPGAPGRARRVGLVGETLAQAREVMVFGESGILACAPPDRRPEWRATRNLLVWPNGAEAQVLSAHDPDALRGFQFDALWADEIAKWRQGQAAWDMLSLGLRLGTAPRACITTTPRNAPVLTGLMAQPSTVMTHAPTRANRAWLAPGFLDEVERRYGGTRAGRQELEGLLVADTEGALWTRAMLETAAAAVPPVLDRIVVAVDPPVSGHRGSDACGIVVAGVSMRGAPRDWRAHVLEDASVQGVSPGEWARAAVAAFHRHGAGRLVAEVNQGGALVEEVIRQIDPQIPYRAVHATRGKTARAEPVAALYEQGRVGHARGLEALEEQMARMTLRGYDGPGSPDRVDALVWALTELVVRPSAGFRQPLLRAI